jgi:sigma-B regulation protein RsbU (phosphoserine phosphatase)
VVEALNRHFVEQEDCRYYFTMVYGVLNVENGRGELCQAGHPHPLIVASGQKVKRLGAGGFPVGMLSNAFYESVVFRLDEGERLVVYSDGITDCVGSNGEAFGEQRLANLLGQIHGEPLATAIEQVDERLRQWRGGGAAEDDMSLLAIDNLAAAPVAAG